MLLQKMENLKRSSAVAGLDDLHQDEHHLDSDDSCETDDRSSQGSRSDTPQPKSGKKTRGRVRINMEFIDNKLRRYTTFSKRKSGIMKKAHELATLTGTQVMLLVASETGHVYTFATRKLQPILSSEAGKQLIQTCLNSPDPNEASSPSSQDDQRMSAQGFEEPELSYVPPDDSKDGLLQKTYHILNAMSAQRERSPTPQQRHNLESQTSSSANLTNYSTVDVGKTALPFPPSQSFALMPSQSVSPQLDQQQFQLAASSAGVRMQMVPVLHERSVCSSLPPSDGHNPQNSTVARTIDESRIALLNPYNNLQRPVAGVQQLLVAGPGTLPMPSAQVALLGQNENNKKTSR